MSRPPVSGSLSNLSSWLMILATLFPAAPQAQPTPPEESRTSPKLAISDDSSTSAGRPVLTEELKSLMRRLESPEEGDVDDAIRSLQRLGHRDANIWCRLLWETPATKAGHSEHLHEKKRQRINARAARILLDDALKAAGGAEDLRKLSEELFASDRDGAIRRINAVFAKASARELPILALLPFHPDSTVRSQGVMWLTQWGHPCAEPYFKASLEDPAPQVRCMAICGLSKLRKEGASALLAPLLDDPSWEVRQQAIRSLGDLDDRTQAARIRSLLPGNDPILVPHAIRIVGRWKDRESLVSLIALVNDPKAPYRSAATLAIGQIGDPSTIPLLADLLLKDADPRVRDSAASAIEALSEEEWRFRNKIDAARDWLAARGMATLPSSDPGTIRSLHAQLGNDDVKIRGQAAAGLLEIAKRQPFAIFLHLPPESDDLETEALSKSVRQKAAATLAFDFRVRDAEALRFSRDAAPLLPLLKGPDVGVRRAVLYVLGKSGNKTFGDAIAACAEDPGLAEEAFRAIVNLRDRDRIPWIIERLSAKDTWVVHCAIRTLGDLGDEGEIPRLARFLEKEIHRSAALGALQKIIQPMPSRPALIFRGATVALGLEPERAKDLEQDFQKAREDLLREEARHARIERKGDEIRIRIEPFSEEGKRLKERWYKHLQSRLTPEEHAKGLRLEQGMAIAGGAQTDGAPGSLLGDLGAFAAEIEIRKTGEGLHSVTIQRTIVLPRPATMRFQHDRVAGTTLREAFGPLLDLK